MRTRETKTKENEKGTTYQVLELKLCCKQMNKKEVFFEIEENENGEERKLN